MPESAPFSPWASVAASAARVAAIFCLVVGALLALNQARLAKSDPLNAPALIDLRRQFDGAQDDDALKARIREEDLRARQAYFAIQARGRTGARLLLGGALALIASLAALSLLNVRSPVVPESGPAHADADRRRAARRGLAAGALVLLAAAALAAGLAWRGFRDPASTLNAPSGPPSSNPEPGTR